MCVIPGYDRISKTDRCLIRDRGPMMKRLNQSFDRCKLDRCDPSLGFEETQRSLRYVKRSLSNPN